MKINVQRKIALVPKTKRMGRKRLYALTAQKLILAGFHYGDIPSTAHKNMSPFVLGKTKAFSRYAFISKKKNASQPGLTTSRAEVMTFETLNKYHSNSIEVTDKLYEKVRSMCSGLQGSRVRQFIASKIMVNKKEKTLQFKKFRQNSFQKTTRVNKTQL